MRVLKNLLTAGIFALSTTQTIAASWTFTDATISIQSKGTGVGGSRKDVYDGNEQRPVADVLISRSLSPSKPLAKPIELGPNDSLKVILTTQEDKTAKRPSQAFLLLKDTTSGLDISYPLSVKETGKGKVDLVCPLCQFLNPPILQASPRCPYRPCIHHLVII